MTDSIYAITMPKWGIEMQEGTVVEWHATAGSTIAAGDELIDIETDKIVNTMEASMSGVLCRCLVDKGVTLRVGSLLGVIAAAEVDNEVIDEFIAGYKTTGTVPKNDTQSREKQDQAPQSAPSEPAPAAPTPVAAAPGAPARRVRVSPAAAQRARELGMDISQVTGTGRRITPEDVERYAQQHPDSGDEVADQPAYETLPLSATRKTIARRLVEAKQQIPHFYLSIDVNMDAALARRAEINAQGTQNISVNDIVMRAAVLCLQALPDVNIHLVDEEIRRFRQVNLAMAVATEKGIITPVMHKAESLTIHELAKAATALGEQARNASLKREDLEGGTFTVTNLGMYGISEFHAIINPPQAAILALGVCEERIIPVADGVQKARMMRATLSCDHRAIDGALGAQFLSQFKAILEKTAEL